MTFKFNFFLSIFFSGFIFSQNYYVSDNFGLDSNDGSESDPFKTINRAILAVNPGGTIYVMEGVYRNNDYGTVDVSNYTNMNNNHVVTINKSGTQGNYITLRNYPGDLPLIEFDGRGGIVISNNMNYIVVEGFEVVGPSQDIDYDMAMANRAYKVQVAEDNDSSTNFNHTYFSGKGIWGGYGAHHHIIIRNNIVHDTPGSGIRFNDSDHITIEYNTVYNTTWWTSSASSAVVYAETIASSESDNGTDIKMIMRGNTVYNNWNRIPFYVTQLPDNSGNTNPNYGTASYNSILDGQGLYVTRSDDNYNGTFLFENNLCVNNGKNGINFDNSLAASAIYRNNTLYLNGVHEYIQNQSVAEGNSAHRGQNVAGIKANRVLNATVVNNIVVTRSLEDAPSWYSNGFTALQLNNVYGIRTAANNIFVNGSYAWPATDTNNLINLDPIFVLAPTDTQGPIDMSAADFSLQENSPAIDAGDSNFVPDFDILGNPRPQPQQQPNAISYTSFENSTGGWDPFGSTILSSDSESRSGDKSLLITDRTANWHAPKINLHNLGLVQGMTYTFYVWAKLNLGASGTARLTTKETIPAETQDDGPTAIYNNLTTLINLSNTNWTLLSADYTHDTENDIFLYVKGPTVVPDSDGNGNIGADFYIDDFSLVPFGEPEVIFTFSDDIVDIGAYEYINTALSSTEINSSLSDFFVYPNPVKNQLSVSKITANIRVLVTDMMGKTHLLSQQCDQDEQSLTLDVSALNTGLYLLRLINIDTQAAQTFRFVKQ